MSQPSRQKDSPTPPVAPARGAAIAVPKPARGWWARLWWEVRDASGLNHTATYLWPRWLVLRAVGIVFLFVFGGIIAESQALIGPNGIAPLDEFFRQLRAAHPGLIDALMSAPSLFWFGHGAGMVTFLGWLGMAAAVALVFNLWPRMALFGCWLVFLSFCATWRVFSPAQLDNLMLEVALLCIPFAPAGYRPGLGADSPPRPIAIFMVRWLLFRVMFEAGLVKLTAGDPRWRDLTAMEVMYETSPFPTILAWYDHHMPHVYHLFEIALTFVAELLAPVAAVVAGRRGRWLAVISWTAFQVGIQLTSNFGWLNTASIGLGLLWLDDRMLADAARKLRLPRLAAFLSARLQALAPQPLPVWQRYSLRGALWLHFYLTLFFLAKACGIPPAAVPKTIAWPVNQLAEFRMANGYYLYALFKKERYQVEYEGSNDGGITWRTYEYRYMPQDPARICGFIAPRFERFEATIEIVAWTDKKARLIPVVASHLLARNPEVMRLFRNDPFAGDRPPTVVRMHGYRFTFTDPATREKTGRFWNKEPAGDYAPAVYFDEQGRIQEAGIDEADAVMRSGDYAAGVALFARQFQAGNIAAGYRLADMYSRGRGVRPDPDRTFALYKALADYGETGGEHNLAVCYEYGVGTAIDYAQAAYWYGRAAEHGYLFAGYNLGLMHVKDLIRPRDDVEGLALLLVAKERAKGDDPMHQFIAGDVDAQIRTISARMSSADTAKARLEAAQRVKDDNVTPVLLLDPQNNGGF